MTFVLNTELGGFLDSLRFLSVAEGKRISISKICKLIPMSTHTYMKVKRA